MKALGCRRGLLRYDLWLQLSKVTGLTLLLLHYSIEIGYLVLYAQAD